MVLTFRDWILTRKTTAQQLVVIGLSGLITVFVINLAAQLGFEQRDAVFFNTLWWSLWFPIYSVWGILLLTGVGLRRVERKPELQL